MKDIRVSLAFFFPLVIPGGVRLETSLPKGQNEIAVAASCMRAGRKLNIVVRALILFFFVSWEAVRYASMGRSETGWLSGDGEKLPE